MVKIIIRLWILLSFLCLKDSIAQSHVPSCPPSNTGQSVSIIHIPEISGLSEQVPVYRRIYEPDIALEVEYDEHSSLICATPLSGLSLYWPDAVRAMVKKPDMAASIGPKRFLVVLPMPGFADLARDMRDVSLTTGRCIANDSLAKLLRTGRVLLNKNDAKAEAEKCFELAVEVASDSVAAEYGAAIAGAILKHTNVAIAHYAKLTLLRPQFYEAKIEEARLYGQIGQTERAERVLSPLLTGETPLPIHARVADTLTRLYDQQDRRVDALETKQLWWKDMRSIRDRYSLLGKDYEMFISGEDLGLRLEEQKHYQDAERQYQNVLDLGLSNDKVSEETRFELDMGRSRCAFQLGDIAMAKNICSRWHDRLREIGPRLELGQWRGESLRQGMWELSCGDFAKGLRLIRTAAERNRTADHGDPYREAAPYWALETIYRARGEGKLAKLAHDTAEEILARRNLGALDQILPKIESLFGTENK